LPPFQECVQVVDMGAGEIAPVCQGEAEELFAALVLGLRDYAGKCGFKSVVLGLSGGIDSAVTAVIAAEALGAQAVHGAAMPTQFSSAGSIEDSRLLARTLGIHFYTIPIQRSRPSRSSFASSSPGCPRIRRRRTCNPGCGR